MAYNSNPGPADEDMLSDSEGAKSADESSDKESTSEETGETALVPSSLCPGMKPGEEMVVEILEVQDGQYLVKYAPEKGDKEDYSEKEQTPSKDYSGDKEMDEMMS